MPLVYLSCAWITGIFLGSGFYLPLTLTLIGLVPLLLLFFFSQYRKTIILISLGIIALLGAAAYSYASLHTVDENSLHFYNNHGTVAVRGMIARDPEVRDKNTHLYLSVSEIKLGDSWQAVQGTVLLFVPRYPAYEYGDVLLVSAKLETPPQFEDFDYENYLVHQGIYSIMSYPGIELQETGKGFMPLEWVYALRNHIAQTIDEVIPEPQAALARGIILGKRGNIPDSIKADFARSGTAHLLAISGLHLGIIAGMMISIGIWLFGRKRYLYVWLALGTIWLYALLTGLHPPVVRGAIMASMFLAAEFLGRQRSAITALTLAAAIMAGISPYILGNASFQLSFLAMAGLVFLFPAFQSLGRRIEARILGEEGALVSAANLAIDGFSVTLAAITAVWPLVAYYFGIVSLVGPLATFLALPVLPGIIAAGTLTGILGFIALPAAQVAGWLTWLFLLYIVAVVQVLATPALAAIQVSSVSITFIWAYYSFFALAIWLTRSRGRLTNPLPTAITRLKIGVTTSTGFISRLPRKLIIPPLLMIAIMVSFAAFTMPDDKLHVSFLDVGEGDAILIQKGSQQILIDGGPSPQAINLELGKKMPFWDRTIELVILTHPHNDHLAGLVEVLQRFHVKQALYPDLTYESPLYSEWQKLIAEKQIRPSTTKSGQQIELGEGTTIKILNPQPTPFTNTRSDIDNNNIVLLLSSGEVSFLLTADIMQEAEWELIRSRADLTGTVLKVPHHGSDTSTTPEFLAVVNPRVAVISAGTDNRFGHPSPEVLARLEQAPGAENIFRTDQQGTIEFVTDGKKLWVEIKDR
ncbi:DNA internalization-related competence protein ComEC/Rec2 [Chloroflexota bacterium]